MLELLCSDVVVNPSWNKAKQAGWLSKVASFIYHCFSWKMISNYLILYQTVW